MSTGNVSLTEGTGKNAATYTFTEDALTKFVQRVALASVAGADVMGDPGDTAWASGSGKIITLLKAIAAASVSTAAVPIAMADEYETVAASATDQVIGATGAAGDRLAGILIQPGTTSPGTVVIKDGSTTIYTFPGGASSVADLGTIIVPLGIKSVSDAWKITTGTNVTVVAIGDFT
jgi:hypothetical protein